MMIIIFLLLLWISIIITIIIILVILYCHHCHYSTKSIDWKHFLKSCPKSLRVSDMLPMLRLPNPPPDRGEGRLITLQGMDTYPTWGSLDFFIFKMPIFWRDMLVPWRVHFKIHGGGFFLKMVQVRRKSLQIISTNQDLRMLVRCFKIVVLGMCCWLVGFGWGWLGLILNMQKLRRKVTKKAGHIGSTLPFWNERALYWRWLLQMNVFL